MGYKDIKKSLSDSAKSDKGSKRFSKGDLTTLMHAALNDESIEASYYSNPSGDTPVSVVKQPVKAYREAMKDVVSQFGVDKHELDRIHDVEISKKHAEALIDVAQMVQHDYVATGKKLRLPQMAENETTVTLYQDIAPEKVEETKKNVEVDGKMVQVPTGKTIKTGERVITKSSNKVPGWLKSEI